MTGSFGSRAMTMLAIVSVAMTSACGGRATYVRRREPTHVIGDHSRREMPDAISFALRAWAASSADVATRAIDWGASDASGAAELRGVAIGRGARADVARYALGAMTALHRVHAEPSGTTALEALLEIADDHMPDDPGFSAIASVRALEATTELLARSDPGDEDAWWLDELADGVEARIAATRATVAQAGTRVVLAVDLETRARDAATRWLRVRGLAPNAEE